VPTYYQQAIAIRGGDTAAMRDLLIDLAHEVDKLKLTIRAGSTPPPEEAVATAAANTDGGPN